MEGSSEEKSGSPTVETHHRLQLGLLGALEEILRRGQDRALANETLARFVDFTRIHFDTEEALMALAAFPGLEAHAAAHALYLARAREVERAAAAEEPPRTLAAVASLGAALRDHINGFDEDYERWSAARPASPPGR
jgi:hemerythrin